MTLEISHEKGQRGTENCEAFWRHLGDFGRLLGTSWAPRGYQHLIFRGLLVPLVRFWAPLWAQLGAKGLPKSSFLASSRAKISKNDAQNEASEKI